MNAICGCYYYLETTAHQWGRVKQYLPLLDSEVHSTILSTASKTVLKQTFTNPSTTDAIKSCVYTFPLYDGVSVVSFTCRIGSQTLYGRVKEKSQAKEIFDKAVAAGETAGLLEQAAEASDVFSTKLGNIPAGQSVIVEITYVGELKHHETDGIRFTIPTRIAPRYGSATSVDARSTNLPAQGQSGIKITVDVSMPEGAFIKGVQSPSHPIAVSMGTVSTAADADPVMTKASATLALGQASLEKDFVLVVQAKDIGMPQALLETHSTITNHRALMLTLVPKFSLPPSRPEIVFVADRSGSMAGNIPMLVSAMEVFLKSMPVGVKFNICSFGSSVSFLWSKSQSYTKETLNHGTAHLKSFDANMGGTETLSAIRATVERRYKHLPLEIMLLTDGDIWQQEELFRYVNEEVEKSSGKIRVFPLGIGNGVSHSLIEGIARAGNGFAQSVQEGERLDNSVVRMLRGALSPHITDYTLEIKYNEPDDEFEIIEKVTEGMKVLLSDINAPGQPPLKKSKISLFDPTVNPEKEDIKDLKMPALPAGPKIPPPKLLQAPHKIPSLFPFSRSVVYILMSPETIQRNPTSVVLRANSPEGPLELEIPVEVLPSPADTIHQLAARKAVQDLEEGRGWIYDTKDESGTLIKERFPGVFEDLVQKEAVRLGEKFQVAGKWCSFFAVAANSIAEDEMPHDLSLDFGMDMELGMPGMYSVDDQCSANEGFSMLGNFTAENSKVDRAAVKSSGGGGLTSLSSSFLRGPLKKTGQLFGSRQRSLRMASVIQQAAPPPPPSAPKPAAAFGSNMRSLSTPFGAHPAPATGSSNPFGNVAPPGRSFGSGAATGSSSLFGAPPPAAPVVSAPATSSSSVFGNVGAAALFASPPTVPYGRPPQDGRGKGGPAQAFAGSFVAHEPLLRKETVSWSDRSAAEKVLALISRQDFEGWWGEEDEDVRTIMGLEIPPNPTGHGSQRSWVTAVVVCFLEVCMSAEEGTWGLVVEKARDWLSETVGDDAAALAGLESEARKLVKN